jgi:tetratricopeptide (TPR) repeat protein
LFKEAERVCQKILEVQPDFKEAKDKLAQIGEKHSESLAMANQSGAPGEDAASENISIDLFSQEGGEDFFLDGLVADSQKGVKTVIGQEDTESHYNLGIAYKEMGQFDEAISEFEQAKMDSLRYVDCLNLIAGCMIQKGSFAEAEKVFLDALADNISDDDRIILNFEMGVFYSEQEKFAKALDKFHFVLNLNPFYRDVGERVKKLQEKMGGEGDSPDNENMSSNRRKSRISYV